MYERLLNKSEEPSFDEMGCYCGEQKTLFIKTDNYLMSILNMQKEIRFPYGNKYGWGVKYFIKSKHICDVFPENKAFTVMLKLSDDQVEPIYDSLTDNGKNLWNNKYLCGKGGWIHYRILCDEYLNDIKILLDLKINKHTK